MVSLIEWVVYLAACLSAQVVAMAWAARRAGSTRGRVGPAAAILGILFAVGVATTVAAAAAGPSWDIAAGLTGVQLGVAYAVIRRGFRLSAGRALVPFAAVIAVTGIEVAVGLFVVRRLVFEAYVIPTVSMSPTLNVGTRVAADKLVRTPRRWDLVVYHPPNSPGQIYCKRVLALPGETLAYDGRGGVTIDGRAVAVPAVLAGRLHADIAGRNLFRSRYADGQPIRLTNRQLFLIGDNVDRSFDSRMVGPTDAGAVVGVVDLVYWPPGQARVLR